MVVCNEGKKVDLPFILPVALSRFEKKKSLREGNSLFAVVSDGEDRRILFRRRNWILVDRVVKGHPTIPNNYFPFVHLIRTKEERSMVFTRGQRRTRCNDSNDSPQNPLQA